MDNLNLKNLQLSYQAVYDETLCESMDELGLFGEDSLYEEEGSEKYKPTLRRSGLPANLQQAAEFAMQTPSQRKKRKQETEERNERTTLAGDAIKRLKKLKQEQRQREQEQRQREQEESYNLYDLVLSHLLDEGYSDSLEGAEAIIENMSDEWIEEVLSEKLKVFPTQKVAQKAARRYASKDPKQIALADRMTRPEVTQIPFFAYKGSPGGRLIDSGHRKVPTLRDYAKLIARSIKSER